VVGDRAATSLSRLNAVIERRPWPWAVSATIITAAVTYGPYIPHGGFILDDWRIAEQFHREGGGLWEHVRLGVSAAGGHPVSGLYTAVWQWLFGLHASWALAGIAMLGVGASLLLFAVLRRIGAPAVFAIVVCCLVLVCPASDATHLWVAAGGIEFTLLLALGGVLVALRALEHPGWRGVARHLPATLLFAASVLSYDAFGPVALVLILLYLTRAPWRRAVLHWAIDVAVIVPCLLIARSTSSKAIDTGGAAVGSRFSSILRDGFQLLVSNAGTLNGPMAKTPVQWPMAIGIGIAVVVVLSLSQVAGGPVVRRIGRIGIAGVVLVGVGLSVLVVVSGYNPLDAGTANRINVVTGIGVVLVTVSVLVVAILLVLDRRGGGVAVAIVSIVVGLALGGAFVLRVRYHEHGYIASVKEQRAVLDRMAQIELPASGDVVYVAGPPAEAAPKIPVFAAPWDLSGALSLLWDRPVIGVPGAMVSAMRCTQDGVLPEGAFYGPRSLTPYGRALLSGPRGPAARPTSPSQCRRDVRRVGLPLAP
jgi:hypothetical protein